MEGGGWYISKLCTYFLPSFVFMLFALVSTLLCVNVILLLIQSPIFYFVFFHFPDDFVVDFIFIGTFNALCVIEICQLFSLPRCTAASNINFYYCRKLFRCSEFETNSNKWFYIFSFSPKKKGFKSFHPFRHHKHIQCTCTLCIRHTICIVNCKVF